MTLTPAPPLGHRRRRLKGHAERRGTRTGMPTWAMFLFGSVFVGTGGFIALLGLRVVPVDASSIHAPFWVITVCGACFAGGGLAVSGMAAAQLRENLRRHRLALRHAGSPALADHAWDPRGFSPSRWTRPVQSIIMAFFMSLFLSVFNWWAWGADGPVPVKIMVVIFDLVLVAVWWQAVLSTGRALKFSGSRLVFDHFPYRMDEPIALRWMPPRGIARADRGAVTFRCVEEYYEERGGGRNRSRWLVHDELCAEMQSFDVPCPFESGRPVDLRFEIPDGAPPTHLAGTRPVFWELEITLSQRGLDFEERYLVPVYAS